MIGLFHLACLQGSYIGVAPLLFYGKIIFHCVYIPHFFFHAIFSCSNNFLSDTKKNLGLLASADIRACLTLPPKIPLFYPMILFHDCSIFFIKFLMILTYLINSLSGLHVYCLFLPLENSSLSCLIQFYIQCLA